MNKTNNKSESIQKVFAQKCPVCNGFGTLKYGTLQCHACLGKGYLLIQLEKEVKIGAL